MATLSQVFSHTHARTSFGNETSFVYRHSALAACLIEWRMSVGLKVRTAVLYDSFRFVVMLSAGFRILKHTSQSVVEEDGFFKGNQEPESFPYHNHDVSRCTTADIASIRVSLERLNRYLRSLANSLHQSTKLLARCFPC